ncbi:gag-polypeptide of LTR copia-type domain-containing protein [Phthorimaea operculella]|nr:gag-polypeptide of LTR copia-type domain-containing protein [Phthorimaea operculella]
MDKCSGSGVKLRGAENWSVWKYHMSVLFKSSKCSELLTREPTKDDEKEVDLDAKAQYMIISRLEESILANLTTCQTTYAIWSKLLSIYEQTSSVSKHLLHQQFYSLAFEGSVASFLGQIEELRSRLKAKGEELTDNMINTKILMSLPDQYKHFVSAWESVAEASQTFNELCARLYIEETRLNSKEDDEEVFLTTTGSNKWVLDSGATEHMTFDRTIIEEYKEVTTPRTVTIGDGTKLDVLSTGTVRQESVWTRVTLQEAINFITT